MLLSTLRVCGLLEVTVVKTLETFPVPEFVKSRVTLLICPETSPLFGEENVSFESPSTVTVNVVLWFRETSGSFVEFVKTALQKIVVGKLYFPIETFPARF